MDLRPAGSSRCAAAGERCIVRDDSFSRLRDAPAMVAMISGASGRVKTHPGMDRIASGIVDPLDFIDFVENLLDKWIVFS
jgi:hypothetical protein